MTHPLGDMPALQPYLTPLRALGYTTYEQLISAAQTAGPELAAYLGLESLNPLLAQITTPPSAISEELREQLDALPCALGVALDRVPRLTNAPTFTPPMAPMPQVNLIAKLPPIRNQGSRGTCVAHAALAAYEHALTTQGAYQDLSEQFLYWNCKRNDNQSNISGTYLGVGFPALKRDGCCLEPIWPYVPVPIAGNEGHEPPPSGAQLEALAFRLNGFHQLSATSVRDIKNELARERCVAVSIPVFNSWHLSPEIRRTGEITNPIPGEFQNGGHAICLVGYVDIADSPEIDGGRFLVRNSWGTTWGIDSPYGPGYGTIPYSYIAKFGMEAYTIE